MAYLGLMDCNNFFVSCERLFRPDLWNQPVAVLSSNDGCIVARSNEVKAMGIPMGIPLFKAKQLADMSQVTLFSSNFTLYRDISTRVMSVLAAEVGACEVYSVDEAFFAVPEGVSEADIFVLRQQIMQRVGIPISIGVAKTKTLAKVASELEKKGSGVCWLIPPKWAVVAKTYPCGEVWNLGRATTRKLQSDGVTTAAQFMALNQAYVQKQFGIQGRRIQTELNGVVVHKLNEQPEDIRKSLTSSRSFASPSSSLAELESAVSYHVMQVACKLRAMKLRAGAMHLSVQPSRHGDWVLRGIRGEVRLPEPSNDTQVLTKAALGVLQAQFDAAVPYKKAGITLARIVPDSFVQGTLFNCDTKEQPTSSVLDVVSDLVNTRFGSGALRLATVLKSGPKTSRRLCSPPYTTSWGDIPRVGAK